MNATAPPGPIVAGHQPNFFPWFGYFEKMRKCDVFVFSNDVRYPKQTYVNRVEVPIHGQPSYLTLPVKYGHDERIAGKLYFKDEKILVDLLRTVRINFSREPHFAELEPILAEFERAYWAHETLADLNIAMILHIAGLLGVRPKTVRGTDLGLEAYHRNERLIRRCELLGSRVYLSGQGADAYQDEAQLRAAGIELRRIDYGIGQKTLGEDLRYSILYAVAKVGIAALARAMADADFEPVPIPN